MNSFLSNASYEWMWKDELWLPPGMKFADLRPEDGFAFAQKGDLFILPVAAIFIYLLRLVFSRFVAIPLANFLNLQEKTHIVEENDVLETFYRSIDPIPDDKQIKVLTKKLDWTQRKIERWFRRRRNKDRLSKRTKFVETSWRFLFYAVAACIGTYTIAKAPLIWGNEDFWTVMPASYWPEVYYYYVIEGSFYLSLLFSITSDVKRKDFNAQFIHHIATLNLIIFSYCGNFSRIGIIVMLLHDLSDIFLELGKCLSYIKYEASAEVMFTIFAVVFIVTRVFIFPFYVLRLTMFEFLPWGKWNFGIWFFNAFLSTLQVLHLYWTSIILRMVWTQICTGVKNDERSDLEEASTDGGDD